MGITSHQIKDFVAYARNPDTWVLGARRNLAVSGLLARHVEALRQAQDHDVIEFSGCLYASYLHAGAAIENAAKAVLVSRNPAIVSPQGIVRVKEFGRRSGHALIAPARDILGSLTSEEERILAKLEEAVWIGRYALPMSVAALYDRMDVLRYSTMDEADVVQHLTEGLIAHVSKEPAA